MGHRLPQGRLISPVHQNRLFLVSVLHGCTRQGRALPSSRQNVDSHTFTLPVGEGARRVSNREKIPEFRNSAESKK